MSLFTAPIWGFFYFISNYTVVDIYLRIISLNLLLTIMNKYFTQFNAFITPYGLAEPHILQLNQLCEVVSMNKGEVIIKSGLKVNCIYFICNGIVRNYIFTDNGEIKTYGFRIENMLVTGYGLHNYQNEYRAKVSVECLEDCTMIKIPLSALKIIEENSSESQKVARHLAENHLLGLVDFIIDVDTKSLLDRYNNLDNLFPNIHQRVPQHIIASYLGTTPVHLSRLKNARRAS